MDSNSLLPRATVISLPRHASRRAHIIKELSSKNVPFTWMDAIDGVKLTHSELSKNATDLGRWFMTPGMIGCFLSHRRCWEQCIETNRPLIVFEDDVILADNFCEVVTATMRTLNANANVKENEDSLSDLNSWDVILLGAIGCVHPEKKFGVNLVPSLVGGKWRKTRTVADVFVEQRNIIEEEAEEEDSIHSETKKLVSSLLHVPLCPYGCHAYILSPRGATKLLNNCNRASYHVDVVAWGIKELNLLAIHPLIAWQTNHDTTIGGGSNLWRYLNVFPKDDYTGVDAGKGLTAPLLRIGGPVCEKLLLTNGSSLLIMFVGLLLAFLARSTRILGGTLVYVAAIATLVRLLTSMQ